MINVLILNIIKKFQSFIYKYTFFYLFINFWFKRFNQLFIDLKKYYQEFLKNDLKFI